MAISVIYDEAGLVLAAQEVPTQTGPETVKLIPGPGQKHAILDAPAKYQGKPFAEVAPLLKVSLGSGSLSLIDK